MALARFPHLKDAKAVDKSPRGSGRRPRSFLSADLAKASPGSPRRSIPSLSSCERAISRPTNTRSLLGGREFEPDEENPMLGFRGASRYYDAALHGGFALECAAMRRVRERDGALPTSCHDPVLPHARGSRQGARGDGRERPRHAVRTASRFTSCARYPRTSCWPRSFSSSFDGFSIGSNDLTQLDARSRPRFRHRRAPVRRAERAVTRLIAARSWRLSAAGSRSASAVRRRRTIRISRSGSSVRASIRSR